MTRFVLTRLLQTVPLLFLVSLLVFALLSLIPGDYLTEFELNPAISRQTVEELRRDYGLDRPFYSQYFLWLGQVLRGNLGYSFAQQRPAFDLIRERLAHTLLLTAGAFLLALVIAVPLGILSALHVRSWPDAAGQIFSLLALSLPTVLTSLFFLYLAFWTGRFPLGGTGGLQHLVLPALTLALPSAAFLLRLLRVEMVEALRKPFVTLAVAKGLPRHKVVYHAFRSAVNPVISASGIILGGFLSGAVIVEKVFHWPGLGALTVDSILARDLFVVSNCVLVAATLTVFANFLADLALAWNDPRIRYR